MPLTGPAALDQVPARGRYLLFAAPWVLAAGLAVAGLVSGRSATGTAGAFDDAGTPDIEVLPPDAAVAPDATVERPAEGRDELLPAVLVADVLATARAALGTAGLVDTDIGPHGTRWPIETHVVAVDRVASRLAVVTVHGLVLERSGERWSGPDLRAVAVPLFLSPTPSVAGPAWSLARPVEQPRPPLPVSPLDDPGAAIDVTDALTAAGWEVAAITGIDDLGDAVIAVTFVGRHGDGGAPIAHTVWLHRTADRSVLLPTTSTTFTTTTPTGVPTGQETT